MTADLGDRVVLVGEDNPRGSDPRFALFPHPAGCAGWRLAVQVMGIGRAEYLRRFERVNLCAGPWVEEHARQVAWDLARSGRRLVLLGVKVARAFEVERRPFSEVALPPGAAGRALCLPHPSGRCREWNDPAAVERARRALRDFGAL